MTTEPGTKYAALAVELEAQIRRSSFQGGKIPPVRELAERHSVSVATATRALQILRARGLIQMVQRSGCFVVPGHASPVERWALCLRTTPCPYEQATQAMTHVGFDKLTRTGKHAFEPALIDPEADPPELRGQARAAVLAGVKGVFLLPARLSAEAATRDDAVLDACREVGLPVVLLEWNLLGDGRPLAADLVCSDDADGGRQLTRHLRDQGRRRIGFVTGSPTSSHIDRISGYLYALHADGIGSPMVFTLAADLSPRDGYDKLCDEFLMAGADAVIGFSDYTAFGVIMEMIRRGFRVPRTLAVAGFDDLPIGHTFTIGLTTYAFPSSALAVQAVEVMRWRIANPSSPFVKQVIPGRLIVRESTTDLPDARRLS